MNVKTRFLKGPMMRRSIWIVGAGHMGRSTLQILASHDPEWTFTVVDRSDESLHAAVMAIGRDRVTPVRLDVTCDDLEISECDLILNFAGPFFGASTKVVKAAIASRTPYIDIADDIEATQAILELDGEARAAGVTIVTGAGLSPGVSNWLAASLIRAIPATDQVRIAWVTHEPDPGGLAPLRHMLHMAVEPALNLVDGELRESPGFRPETARTYRFPAPLNEIEAYDTAHPEPLTLARSFPQLQNIQCQGSLQPEWANQTFSALGRIGFGYDEKVELQGLAIDPTEVLWQLMWKRYRARSRPTSQALTAVRVEALSGERLLGALTVLDHDLMAVGTGLGAAAAALVALDSELPSGAYGPEVIDQDLALAHFTMLARRQSAFSEGILSE